MSLAIAFGLIVFALTVFLSQHWVRVTVRDHEAAKSRRMSQGLRWHGDKVVTRKKAGSARKRR